MSLPVTMIFCFFLNKSVCVIFTHVHTHTCYSKQIEGFLKSVFSRKKLIRV